MKSRMMQTALFTCLLAAFIVLGGALECEQCMEFTNYCTGPMVQCPHGQDTCSVSVTSIDLSGLVSVEKNVFEKACSSSKLCGKGPFIINLGPLGATTTESQCCVGDGCRKRLPMPRRNTTLNGRQCSTCPSDGTACKSPPIQCAGEETRCFELSGTTTLGGQHINTILKGCANELACKTMETNTEMLGNMVHEVQSARCTDGAAGATLRSLGLLLPALSGLLLVKFLA